MLFTAEQEVDHFVVVVGQSQCLVVCFYRVMQWWFK